jgi:hypothetical protein
MELETTIMGILGPRGGIASRFRRASGIGG